MRAKDSKPIVDEWRAYDKQRRPDSHLWASMIARKFGVPVRTVRRWLNQAGCRK
jgi:transposase-like protein